MAASDPNNNCNKCYNHRLIENRSCGTGIHLGLACLK